MRRLKIKPQWGKLVAVAIVVFLAVWLTVMAAVVKAAWLCLFGSLCS